MRKTKLTSTLTTIFLLAFFVLSSVQPVSSRPIESARMQDATSYPYVPDVILIGIQAGVTLEVNSKDNPAQPYKTDSAALERALKSIGVRSLEPLFASELIQQIMIQAQAGESLTTYRLRLAEGTDIQAAVKELAALSEVRFAEPDYIAFPAEAPASMPALAPVTSQLTIDDPLYAQQWGLAKINIEGAWDDTYGSPIVTIAIIDSGIDLSHVDLAGNLWVNPGEIANNGLDDDSNGFVDDVNGWNFISGSKDVSDENGHGTLVAGVAAAIGGNGQGIAGVCPQCRIMPVKVTQTSGTANYSDVAAGVLYAAQKGARVINISLGGYANSNILKNAIDTAVNGYGAVVVAGAGNDNLNQSFYPAAYENVLAVAGTQIDDTKVGTSNYGAWVDVTAPGIDIRTTALGGGWLDNSGTSFAAPFASGLAGLLKTLHPDWSQALIRSQIAHTADSVDGVNPTLTGLLGRGRINAGSAMQTPHPVLQVAGYSVDGLANGRPVLGATSNMIVTLNNDWWDAPNVTGTLSTTDPYASIANGSASFGSIPAGTTAVNATAFTFSVNPAAGYNHPISFNLNVSDTNGYATTLNFTVTTEAGVVNKSGTIVADETWTNDKTYLIVNNVNVPSGVTLTIQPGTTIKFNGNYSLNVRGALLANASASQPIFFKSNTAGAWDRIFFDDTSLDAVADGSGGYLSGSILRHVNIESSTGGIDCTAATPYLAHINLTGGGMACTLGATPIWFMDNTISGGASFTGNGNAFRNTVTAGGLSISGAGILEENVVSGGILSLGSGAARRNTAASGLSVGGSGGAMEENTVTGNVSIGDSFAVTKNTINGKLTVGNAATVDHNTVSNGITVGSSATVTWNNVEDAEGTCLISGDGVTAQFNRLIGCGSGMSATSGLIEHNLIANNEGVGLQVGAATVQYNTLTGNAGYTILVQGGMPLSLSNNNLELNSGAFDIYSNIASGSGSIPAQNNWWGTTDGTTISNRIYDYSDDDLKAPVAYSPMLTGPDQSAPGYVRAVNVLPDNTLGIQTGTFEVQFSKPMDTNNAPSLEFYTTRKGTWSQYTSANSGLPVNYVRIIAAEANGTKWFGTSGAGIASFDGSNWVTYNSSNSGLPANSIMEIAIEANGTKWFGTSGGGAASFDGSNWVVYNSSNSGLPNDSILAIAIEANGTKWFGTSDGGVASFDGSNWVTYNSSNSGLPNNSIQEIAIEANGTKWFGTSGGGVTSFEGSNWVSYNSSNSGLPNNSIQEIAIEANGTKWFGTSGAGAASFDGTHWVIYNASNSGLPGNFVYAIAIEANGTKWFGTSAGVASFDGTHWVIYNSSNSGLPTNEVVTIAIEPNGTKWFGFDTFGFGLGAAALQGGYSYSITANPAWTSSTSYRVSYDITSEIPKDTYRINLNNALDPDGMRVASFSSSTFAVDYAGSISDTTPPSQPTVSASGDGGLTSLSATWNSTDPESPITEYRYAIGTTPGGRDVVGWTYTNNTFMTHSGLSLTPGLTYYVSAGARNEGGLWSESGVSNGVVAGAIPPAAFNKTSPANGAAGQATNLTFVWSASSGAESYEYCYDTSNDNNCSNWVSSGTTTSANIAGLAAGTTYYWHVRANNSGGTSYANDNTAAFWSFTTAGTPSTPPGAFNKTSPVNGATGLATNLTLIWSASSGAVSYEYCYDSSNDNACSNWVSVGTNTSVSLPGLAVNTTYYWHVRANNAGGTTYANGSTTTFWSFATGSTVTVATFTDVPITYWAWSFIERLYNAGITGGCATTPILLYCPDATVTRAQMAVFLLKSMHGPTFTPPQVGDSTGFGDVATSHWAAPWIKQLALEGITGGCGNGNYCPEAPVTRAQMAVFLLKARNGSGYAPPLIGDGSGFTDVPANYWAAVWIKQLAADGITGGCGAGIYCPENPVTRAQMAVFIVKTFGLP